MNCNICAAYLGAKHDVNSEGVRMRYCAGCRSRKSPCAFLKKKCDLLIEGEVEYCYECKDFPCDRLSSIDERYRKRFRMSEIENLTCIRERGINAFLRAERKKWRCPKCGGFISCHNGLCFDCDLDKLKSRKNKYTWDRAERTPLPEKRERG